MASLHFTINACNRCRKRKIKCDTDMPACSLCQNTGSVCEYTDPRSKITYPRTSICQLEDEISRLELEIEQLANKSARCADRDSADDRNASSAAGRSRTSDEQARPGPDLIRLESGGDAHFLGVSSGMHLARSVLESARQNNAAFDNSESPANCSWAAQSPVTAPATHGEPEPEAQTKVAALPSLETTCHLIDIFFKQYQVQYPILVQDDFVTEISNLYNSEHANLASGGDPWTRFMLNMVLSISLIYLSRDSPQSLSLARNFRSSAVAQLGTIMQSKCHRTLQCLFLLLLSSILNSTSSPIWYISGLCIRLVVDLGFHSEKMIKLQGRDFASESEIDLKRRLFWVAYTFDRTLAIMLGRPFTLEDDNIDVQLPTLTLPSEKRPHILHWIGLQRLQSEIVYRLYINRDNCVQTRRDESPEFSSWTSEMAQKIHMWNDEASTLTDTDIDWWRFWYYNAMLMLHRPTPMARRPANRATATVYESAKNMIHLSFIRVNKGLTDVSWLELHCQLMSGITLLFLVLKIPEARERARSEWTPFKSCLVEWQCVLEMLTRRWERMGRTRAVLTRLADATIDIVEKEMIKGPRAAESGSYVKPSQLDRDRRKSIIQQLESLGHMQHERIRQRPQAEHVALQDMPQFLTFQGEDTPLRNLANVAEVAGRLESSTTTETMDVLSAVSHNRAHTGTSQTYDNAQLYSPPQSMQNAPLFGHGDLTAILENEVWSEFQSDDASVQANFSIFDYLSIPVDGPETAAFPILPLAFGSNQSGNLTDSVLNFHSSMNGGDNFPST